MRFSEFNLLSNPFLRHLYSIPFLNKKFRLLSSDDGKIVKKKQNDQKIEEFSIKEIYNGILKVYELLIGGKHEPEK